MTGPIGRSEADLEVKGGADSGGLMGREDEEGRTRDDGGA